MRDAFVKNLTAIAEQDRRVVLVTGDLGFGVLDEFRRRCPRQFLNVGVAEQNMIGVATGLALDGHVVFTYSIANFAFMRCLEQIRNDASYHDCNVKVVAVGGGLSYGSLGISHHATEDLAIMRSIPGVCVVAPGDDYEASQAATALHERPGVGYVRLDRAGAGVQSADGDTFALGKARVMRDGDDITLVGTGGILAEALAAADMLAKGGVSCRVLSMHTVKPLDHAQLLDAARATGGIVTVEEHTVDGGLGGAVAEFLLEAGASPGVFRRIGLRCGFSAIVGSQDYLRQRYGLDRLAIVETVHAALASQVPSVARRRAA